MNYPGNKMQEPQTSTAKFAALGASPLLKSGRKVPDENDFLTDNVSVRLI